MGTGAMDNSDARERWFCELVDAGLSEAIFDSSALMNHATPEVLASNLPPELMAKVLEAALSAGKMTTDRMLETLTPSVIAHHIPHEVLWDCVVDAAKRSGIADTRGDVPSADKRRAFLRRALTHGLDTKVLTSDDILDHVTPDVLSTQLPNNLKAKLLTEALRADKMNPSLIVEVLGVEELAAHVKLAVLWECLFEAGDRLLGSTVEGAVDKKKKKDAKAASAVGPRRSGAGKAKKGARAPTNKAGTFDDDTNVNDWAGADEFEVVEESDLAAMPDQAIGDWSGDEETNVGVDSGRRQK